MIHCERVDYLHTRGGRRIAVRRADDGVELQLQGSEGSDWRDIGGRFLFVHNHVIHKLGEMLIEMAPRGSGVGE